MKIVIFHNFFAPLLRIFVIRRFIGRRKDFTITETGMTFEKTRHCVEAKQFQIKFKFQI